MRKALVIGIAYKGKSCELFGTVNDAKNFKKYLEDRQYVVVFMSDEEGIKPTRNAILQELMKLIGESKSGDKIFIYYAGHGSQTKDRNKDENDGYDEYLCPLDGIITDDELYAIIVRCVDPGVKVRCIFDCCHSGTCLDLQWRWLTDKKYYKENTENIVKDIVCVSGCMDSQTSAETWVGKDDVYEGDFGGALSYCFIKAMDFVNKNYKDMTLKEFMYKIRFLLKSAGYDQVPQLSMSKKIYLDKKVIDLF